VPGNRIDWSIPLLRGKTTRVKSGIIRVRSMPIVNRTRHFCFAKEKQSSSRTPYQRTSQTDRFKCSLRALREIKKELPEAPLLGSSPAAVLRLRSRSLRARQVDKLWGEILADSQEHNGRTRPLLGSRRSPWLPSTVSWLWGPQFVVVYRVAPDACGFAVIP